MPILKDPNAPPQAGSRQGSLIGLQVFFISIALIVYGLRIYTRRFILRSVGNDDYIMGVALLFSIALTLNACISTIYGWATHISSIPDYNIPRLLQTVFLSELLFTLATGFAKLSILFFYLRLAATRTYRRIIWSSIAFITLWVVVFACVVVFQCNPVSSYWHPAHRVCWNPEVALFLHGLTNTMTDVYVFVLPMHMVWHIKLPKRQRIGLLFIFGAGFLVCIAGALRLYYSILTDRSLDTPWEGYYLWTWESIEINLGIVCASAPCLKSMLTRLVPRLFSSHPSGNFPSLSGPGHTFDGRSGAERSGNGKRDPRKGFVMTTITAGRSGRNLDERGESQDDLTDNSGSGHGRSLDAKVDVHDMA